LEKEKIRGYNQSYVMAKKIAELNNMKVLDNVLCRVDESKSQTKKSRYNRFSQNENAFKVNKGFNLENEHLILIDDIVTTGATISACIQQLESFKNIKLSILCIAN
jgi:predicted amidophosphoribosyltransferase